MEAQAHVVHLPATEDRGERERDLALGALVERSREDLPVREVLVSVGRDPGAVSADDEGEVGALGDEAQLLLRAQELDHALQLVREGAPAGNRIAVVEQRGIEDEVLVLGERHLGVLSRPVRGIGGQHPAQLAV